jgi:outer membrane protein assembly factor BamD (BamD/ComL family)
MKGLAITATLLLAAVAQAQNTFQLDPQKGWTARDDAPPNPERAALDQTRRLLAEGKFSPALDTISKWIDEHESADDPLLPEALYLRGNAKLGMGNEFKALFDYEKIATKHTDSRPWFEQALERELDVAILYLNGLRKPSLGLLRIDSGVDVAEEIILRIHERLPFSKLDEKAELELADYYYRDRDLKMAATAYDCFLINFPKSEQREHAMQRKLFATIAQFKGPNYDASGLVEAKYQIQQYQQDFPLQAQTNGIGDSLQARLDESGAAQLLSVARWYLRHGDPPAAHLTLARLVHAHPGTAASREALAIMKTSGWLKEGGSKEEGHDGAPPAGFQPPPEKGE